jgi:RecA-family ATPase
MGSEANRQIYLDEVATETYDGADTIDALLTEYEKSMTPINVLVFDPFMKGIATGNEQEAFPLIANNVDKILAQHDVTIIFVAHQPKREYEDMSQRILGSIKYAASADFIWELTAIKHEEEIQGGRLKYTGKIPSGQFNLQYDRGIWKLSDKEVVSLKTKADRVSKLILDTLEDGDLDESDMKLLALKVGIHGSTFQNALKQLLDEGKVISTPIDRNKRKLSKGV